MTFCCFNPFPWGKVPQRPLEWPYPNRDFDPVSGCEFFRTQIDQLIYAEECGFDWVAVGEDHFTAYGLAPNPNLILSILAHCTKKVRLAIFGAPIPLLNPIRVAEETAMLDLISNGRLVVGLIRGVPQNYEAYQCNPDESRERFEEASALIVKAWTAPEIFSWEGKYYNYPKVSLWPRPIQQPHPPLLYSANSSESAMIGARNRAIIGTIHLYARTAMHSVEVAIAAYKQQAEMDGWTPGPDRFMVGFPTCIAETDGEAFDKLAPALDYQFNVLSGTFNAQKRRIAAETKYGHTPVEENPPTLRERLDRHMVLCGSPSTVTSQIEWLRQELGIGIISMQTKVGNISDSDSRKSMRLFRNEVRPHFDAAISQPLAADGVGA